jgi:hypothetical protein
MFEGEASARMQSLHSCEDMKVWGFDISWYSVAEY